MKRIKTLAPLLLMLLTVLSAYSLISGAAEKNIEFKNHIKNARELAEQGIVVDAAKEYDDAIDMKPSIELYLEKGEMFRKNDMNGNALSLGELMLERYPKESRAYDFLIDCYLANKNYDDCYDLLDTAKKRKLTSDAIVSATKELRYKCDYDYLRYEDVSVFSDGLCAVKNKGFWGYVGETGSLKIDCIFESAGVFSDELAAVRETDEGLFYIDKDGNRKKNIDPSIAAENVGPFANERAGVKAGSGYCYYDKNYKKIAGDFSFAGKYFDGIAAVAQGESWYLIDDKGRKINETPYEAIALNEKGEAFVNGVAFVKENGEYIMVNAKAERIGDQGFADAKPFGDGAYAAVKLGGKWGYVDKDGNIAIEAQYDDAKSFSNDLAAACRGDKWGYINSENETALEFTFNECKDFNAHGCAFAKDEDAWVLIMLLEKNH